MDTLCHWCGIKLAVPRVNPNITGICPGCHARLPGLDVEPDVPCLAWPNPTASLHRRQGDAARRERDACRLVLGILGGLSLVIASQIYTEVSNDSGIIRFMAIGIVLIGLLAGIGRRYPRQVFVSARVIVVALFVLMGFVGMGFVVLFFTVCTG